MLGAPTRRVAGSATPAPEAACRLGSDLAGGTVRVSIPIREAMAQRYFRSAEQPGCKYLVSGSDPLLMKVIPKKLVTWDYS